VAPEDELELVDLRVGPHQLLDPARVDDDARTFFMSSRRACTPPSKAMSVRPQGHFRSPTRWRLVDPVTADSQWRRRAPPGLRGAVRRDDP